MSYMHQLTVGEIRRAIRNLPDRIQVLSYVAEGPDEWKVKIFGIIRSKPRHWTGAGGALNSPTLWFHAAIIVGEEDEPPLTFQGRGLEIGEGWQDDGNGESHFFRIQIPDEKWMTIQIDFDEDCPSKPGVLFGQPNCFSVALAGKTRRTLEILAMPAKQVLRRYVGRIAECRTAPCDQSKF